LAGAPGFEPGNGGIKIRSPTSRLTRRTESLPPVGDGGTHGKMAARDSGSGSVTILKHFGIGDKDER
jgi:hypothetical protein